MVGILIPITSIDRFSVVFRKLHLERTKPSLKSVVCENRNTDHKVFVGTDKKIIFLLLSLWYNHLPQS